MNYESIIRSAFLSLVRNKMRSALTVLGITIGIGAVICVVAIGKAGQIRVEQQLSNLGDNLVWIEEGGRAVNGVKTGTHGMNTLVLADAIAIKNQIPLIKSVSPNVDGSIQVIYGNQNWFTRYRGVSPEYFETLVRRSRSRIWPGRHRQRGRRLRDRPHSAQPAFRYR
jgi:putative ABC transport system permease protein